jgi:hypothetical protein
MSGWLQGLGQGLTQASQAIPYYVQLKQQALQNALAQRQQERADQMAELQQKQLERQLQVDEDRNKREKFEQDFRVWQNSPANVPYNPAAGWDPRLKAIAVTEGPGAQGLENAPIDPTLSALMGGGSTTRETMGRGQEIIRPSETANQRGLMERAQLAQTLALQKEMMRANLQKEANDLKLRLAQYVQNNTNGRHNQSIAMIQQRLDMMKQIAERNALQWDAEYDLDVYNANQPKSGGVNVFSDRIGGGGTVIPTPAPATGGKQPPFKGRQLPPLDLSEFNPNRK